MIEEKTPQGAPADDLQDELNVDASMFSEQERAEMQNRIGRFLTQLKKEEDALTYTRLLTRPLKRVFMLPLFIFVASCLAVVIMSAIFFIGSQRGIDWGSSLFAVRTSGGASEEISDATKELISGIRSENEERIVSLFVDLINTESAEQSPVSEEESEDISTRKDQINSDLVRIQQEQDGELQRQREELREQTGQFQSLQDEFTALSSRYDQANLQLDQYTAMVVEIGNALRNEDEARTVAAVGQLNSLLNSPSIRVNPLLEDIQGIAPVLIYSAELNLSLLRDLQQSFADASTRDANDANTREAADAAATAEAAAAAATAEAAEAAATAEAAAAAAATKAAAEIGELSTRIDQLTRSNRQLNLAVANAADTEGSADAGELSARIDQLTRDNRQLNLELEQTLTELERVRQ